MKTISLCMIVKNEEDNIGNCLDSIKDLVDEIIIVDTGSTDKTKEIVKKYTDKIYDFEWVDDFSKARNYSFSKATKDYIFWLDADDILLEEDRIKFKKMKNEMDGTVDVYTMKYLYSFDENDNPIIIQRRERILKRENNYKWQSPIHEVITPSGIIEDTDISVKHNKKEVKDLTRNLRIFENMIENGEEFDDRQEYCYAKELYFLKQIPEAIIQYNKFINKYINNYEERKEYLYSALIELADCYKQIEEYDKEWETLMLIIKNQIPKKDCLNKIADSFLRKKKYNEAIFWYTKALELESEVEVYNTYYSNICLGVCYYWIGDIEKAIKFNEEAGKIYKNDKLYLENREIYKSIHKTRDNSK